MCNAYKVEASLAKIGEAARLQLGLALVLPAGVTAETSNLVVPKAVFPRRDGLILRPADPDAPEAGLEPVVAHWNLTPLFHKAGLKAWKASTNNCRSESMATSPAFRDAVKRRRCLIPATSFTEWTGPKGSKTAHAISRRDQEVLFLAGLWDRCPTEAGLIDSYTMVMIPAAGEDDVAPFHDRQPVTLERETATIWLDLAADYAPAIRAPVCGTLIADPPEPAAAA